MHKTEIRPDALERILTRRGRRHIHDRLHPDRTALVVIDMQNAFVDPSWQTAVPMAREIVPTINRLAETLRERGGVVVWVSTTFSSATVNDWSALFGGVYSAAFGETVIESLRKDSDGHALWNKLDVRDVDWRASKDRFSVFLPGASDLESRLRQINVDTVLICGTVTNVCCDASARDAMMRNLQVVMVADANVALTDADHNASLTALAQTFADVMNCDEVLARLDT